MIIFSDFLTDKKHDMYLVLAFHYNRKNKELCYYYISSVIKSTKNICDLGMYIYRSRNDSLFAELCTLIEFWMKYIYDEDTYRNEIFELKNK